MSELHAPGTTPPRTEPSSVRFLTGFCAGALIGAAAGVLFSSTRTPAGLRTLPSRLRDAASDVRHAASEGYREASSGIGDAVEQLRQKGRAAFGPALPTAVPGAGGTSEHAPSAPEPGPHAANRAS